MNSEENPAQRPENGGGPSLSNGRFARLKRFEWVLYPLAFVALFFVLRPDPRGPEEGAKLPSVELYDVETHEKVNLASGRPVLLEVFASWCGACKKTNSLLSHLRPGELDFYMVSVDERIDQAKAAKESWPIDVKVLFDTADRASSLWKVNVLPTFILVDEHGNVSRVSTGIPGPLDFHAFSEAAKRSKR